MLPGSQSDFLRLFLQHGVTGVRDVGALDGSWSEVRRRVTDGKSIGPRIFSCGPILDGDPPLQPVARVVETTSSAKTAVLNLIDRNVDCLKVYENLRPEVLAVISRIGDDNSVPVLGHVPRTVTLAESGITEVQHLTGILRPPLSTSISRSRWLVELANRWRDIDQESVEQYVEVSKKKRIRHLPTLVSFWRDSLQANYDKQRGDVSAHLLPRYWRDLLWDPGRDARFKNLVADDWFAFQDAYDRRLDVVGTLHRAGVQILVGTDTPNPFVVPGASLHDELRLLVEAGLSLEEVWAAATTGAGNILGVDGLGRIENGAPADLLIFAEDPTQDLAALDSLKVVIAGGRIYDVMELRRTTRERQVQSERWLYRSVIEFLIRIVMLVGAPS